MRLGRSFLDEEFVLDVEGIEERRCHIQQRSERDAFGDEEVVVDRQIGGGSDCRRVRCDQAATAHLGRDVVAGIEVLATRIAALFDGIKQDGRSRHKQVGDRAKTIVDLG